MVEGQRAVILLSFGENLRENEIIFIDFRHFSDNLPMYYYP